MTSSAPTLSSSSHRHFTSTMPSALVLIADGTEEMEFTITYDTFVRAGITTRSAYVPAAGATSPGASPVAKGSRGIRFLPDIVFDISQSGPDKYDVLVIPGGAPGAATISQNTDVQTLVRQYLDAKKYVGMICAGSLTALTSGLPKQPLTSHPSVKDQLTAQFEYAEEPVVVSGNLVTTRGPGTSFPFALTLVEILCGVDKRKEVQDPMIFPIGTPW